MRACLNTLQFLSKQHAKIKVNDVARLSIGQKDMTKDIFSLWNQLLCSKVQLCCPKLLLSSSSTTVVSALPQVYFDHLVSLHPQEILFLHMQLMKLHQVCKSAKPHCAEMRCQPYVSCYCQTLPFNTDLPKKADTSPSAQLKFRWLSCSPAERGKAECEGRDGAAAPGAG